MNRALVVVAMVVAFTGSVFAQSGSNASDVQKVRRFKVVSPKIVKARDLVAKREFEKAKKEIQQVIEQVPDHHEAHLLMAKVLYGEKRYPEALASIERAEKGFESVAGLVSEMQDDRRKELQRRKTEVRNTLNTLRARMPTQTTSANYNQAAEIQAQIAQYEQTLNEIDHELNTNLAGAMAKEPPEYAFFHGNILLRLQRFPEAVAKYEEALKADPQYADAANNLASIYYEAKRYEQARAVIETIEAHGGAVMPALKAAVLAALKP